MSFDRYDATLLHNLRTDRVFIRIADFLQVALNLGDNFRDRLTSVTDTVLSNQVVRNAFQSYLSQCSEAGPERRLCLPRINLYDAVLGVLDHVDPIGPAKPAVRLVCSSPGHVESEHLMMGLNPDLGTFFETIFDGHQSDALYGYGERMDKATGRETPMVKSLFKGYGYPRVKFNGEDPRKDVILLTPGDPQLSLPPGPLEMDWEACSTSAVPRGCKRRRADSDSSSSEDLTESSSRIPGTTPFCSFTRAQQDDYEYREALRRIDPSRMRYPQIQSARYAMDLLSNTALRSHLVMSLCDRSQFQLSFYHHSAIVTSSIADVADREGQELFVLMLLGLRRLTAEDRGFRNVVDLGDVQISVKRGVVYDGMRIDVDDITYTVDHVIHQQVGLVGSVNAVFSAKRDDDGKPVIVKVSSPVTGRTPADGIPIHAIKSAESNPEHHWVLDHLPRLYGSKTVSPSEGSVEKAMMSFLNSAEYVDEQDQPKWEERVLRIEVMEPLEVLTSLTDAEGVARVFHDVLETMKWLVDVPKIMHRDISMGNIMVRRIEGRVHGVLIDFDLSSFTKDLDTASGLRRTGTPPYMAHELQMSVKKPVKHLFRHDLEALSFVFLILISRYRLEEVEGCKAGWEGPEMKMVRRKESEFDGWFKPELTFRELTEKKMAFFMPFRNQVQEVVDPSFAALIPVVRGLFALLQGGHYKLCSSQTLQCIQEDSMDSETIGGSVTFERFNVVMCSRCPYLRRRYQHPQPDYIP